MAVSRKIDNLQYRRAEQNDIEILTELLCELYENHLYEELLIENKKILGSRQQVLFLAFDSIKPIGVCHGALRSEYINGKEYAGAAGYLEAIYVRPEYRLCGVAASLVGLCEEWARHNGCREFLSDCLLDNAESYIFHLRIGFTETERCIFFRKDLAPYTEFKTAIYRPMLSSDIDFIVAEFATQGWNKRRYVLEGYLNEQKSGERKVIRSEEQHV